MGMCRPVLQILTGFQSKKCNYPNLFSDQTSEIYTSRFHTWSLGRNYVIIIRLGCKHKNYSNPFRICLFLFLSYSFGIETIKMFIHSSSSLENPNRFQTKMGKVYSRFQTKMAQKPYPMGRHIPA